MDEPDTPSCHSSGPRALNPTDEVIPQHVSYIQPYHNLMLNTKIIRKLSSRSVLILILSLECQGKLGQSFKDKIVFAKFRLGMKSTVQFEQISLVYLVRKVV